MTECSYDPRPLLGAPIGMFHCPECGCMVLAGREHGPHDDDCWLLAPPPEGDDVTTDEELLAMELHKSPRTEGDNE